MADAKWIVHTKGGAEQQSFEIAVLREDNRHGIESYGWFGSDKLLISHNGGPCRDPVTAQVWGELVAVAERVAASLNADVVDGTTSGLSDFVRHATPERKAEVFGKVMDKVADQQQAVIDAADGVTPCGGGQR